MADAPVATPSSQSGSTIKTLKSKTANLLQTTASKNVNTTLGYVLLVCAALTMVPSAMGVAQYDAMTCEETEKEKTIFGFQVTFLVIAVLLFLFAAASLVYIAVQKKKTGQSAATSTGGALDSGE